MTEKGYCECSNNYSLPFSTIWLTGEERDDESESRPELKTFLPVVVSRALRYIVKQSLEPHLMVAVKHLTWTVMDATHYLCHLQLTSFIADLPGVKDLLSVKWGSLRFSPSHNCFVTRNKMQNCIVKMFWALWNTLRLTEMLYNDDRCLQYHLKYSMLSLPLILSKVAMVGNTFSVDIQDLFRYAPMHVLSFGTIHTMQECTAYERKDSTRTSTALVTASEVPWSFSANKKLFPAF